MFPILPTAQNKSGKLRIFSPFPSSLQKKKKQQTKKWWEIFKNCSSILLSSFLP
jgi:hypothetical protein